MSEDMIKAIENLEQGHKEMQQSMASIATQQAVTNEQLLSQGKYIEETNNNIKTIAINLDERVRASEIKINTHETRWKIAGPVLLVIVGAVATALFGSFG